MFANLLCEIAQVENGIFGCIYVTQLAAMECCDEFSELPCSKIQLSKIGKNEKYAQETIHQYSERCPKICTFG